MAISRLIAAGRCTQLVARVLQNHLGFAHGHLAKSQNGGIVVKHWVRLFRTFQITHIFRTNLR